jgi:hypothetical protein
MRKFKVPQAEKGSIALHCEYLNIDGKMKPCSLDPHECVMGFRGMVSEDGLTFTPIEQPSIEATLRNCPKLKNRVYKRARGCEEGTQIKENMLTDRHGHPIPL